MRIFGFMFWNYSTVKLRLKLVAISLDKVSRELHKMLLMMKSSSQTSKRIKLIDKTEFISEAQFPNFWLLISYYDWQISYFFPNLENAKFIRSNGRVHHTWRLLVNEHLSQCCRFHWYFCNFISKTSCDNMSDTLTVSYLSFNSKVFIISW
jgi:hypothetical protein